MSTLGERSTNGKTRALFLTQGHIPHELIKVWALKKKKGRKKTVKTAALLFVDRLHHQTCSLSFKVLDVRCSHFSVLFFLAWEVHQSGTARPLLQTSIHHSIDRPPVRASPWCLHRPKKAFPFSAWSASVRCSCSYTDKGLVPEQCQLYWS